MCPQQNNDTYQVSRGRGTIVETSRSYLLIMRLFFKYVRVFVGDFVKSCIKYFRASACERLPISYCFLHLRPKYNREHTWERFPISVFV